MKKLVGIILVVMMMVICGTVYADAYTDLGLFVENDYMASRWYNEDVAAFGIERCLGYFDIQNTIENGDYELDPSIVKEDPMDWFYDWYVEAIKNIVEGSVQVTFGPYGEYNGTQIYRLIIISENEIDLDEYVDGIQTMIDGLVVIF